ncbi:MAG: von Willebrand factor type A domain-containing protein [Clostridia bacterium]|nr:von Willebrand factor type A domain-containing protein [Clostridia bacterium]
MKRKIYSIFFILFVTALLFCVTSCNAMKNDAPGSEDAGNKAPTLNGVVAGTHPENAPATPEDSKNDPDSANKFLENPFIATDENNVSTLSADVDTASYTYFRKLVNSGYSWQELSRYSSNFRTEEFLNYFKYTAEQPSENELFSVNPVLIPCPWNENNVLLSMTLQAADATPTAGNNLVFLIDVSGSMMSSDKLPLLKKAFSHLTDQLGENDIISIVTYSGKETVVLDGCTGNKKETILAAINSLNASGSTNGEAGLQKAYQIAEKHRIEGGNNRIIMASDGDLNVGISSESALKQYITEKREAGIFLSVLGFGTGNYRDEKMETLADNGNGVYLYVDGEGEAEKIFSTDLLANLYTVAKDVKMQITFDKTYVASYRLIGYENRILNEEDFTDDTKDAGEVGAGHQITVCYELRLADGAKVDGAQWLELAVNDKLPDESVSVRPNLYNIGYADYIKTPDADRTFMIAVIETCMLLHSSEYLPEGFDLDNILHSLNALDLSDYPERAEFRTLLTKLNAK